MRRILVLVAALAVVAAACGGAATPASPGVSDPSIPSGGSGSGVLPSATRELEGLRVSTAGWRTDFSRASVDLGDFLSGGPGKDGIPSIDEPVFESIDAARAWLGDRSPVISLQVGGEARAYSPAGLLWPRGG